MGHMQQEEVKNSLIYMASSRLIGATCENLSQKTSKQQTENKNRGGGD